MVEPKYKCPDCSRTIFNRRNSKCEFCGCELPSELLFSSDDIARLEKSRKARERDRRQTSDSNQSTSDSFNLTDWL